MEYAAALVSSDDSQPRPSSRRVSLGLTLALVALALVETGNAVLAPSRAPSNEDWQAAAAAVRAGFRPGDLIVAAPAWSDQVMRLYLGDLVPIPVAARMDAARYGRVWQIAQRGATAPEVSDRTVTSTVRHGALVVSLAERPPARVTYDFLARWTDATVSRREPGRVVACARLADRFACPDLAFNFVKPALLEIDTTLRRALYAQPVANAAVVVEFPAVVLGTELAVASGLHHVWYRKGGDGHVMLRVFVDGQERAVMDAHNRSGFSRNRIDTSALAGRTVPVRFEITSDKPFARHFGFVAEARTP